ncbi:hypothetical protein CFP56_012615 [Quercus suber]|uniref:RNase H type-1 domain-containing protein n=1 Tax=Quercus suber TaxID=58331 RepID=A0AAW0KZF4_QUESU
MWVGSEGCEAVVRNSWNEEERNGDMENLFEQVIEALALRWAIRFATETSFDCVIIESDSLSVVKAIQDTVESICHIGHIIDDVRHLAKAMKSCEFHHKKREANQVAHTLARNAIHVDTMLAWLEEIPPCVSDVIRLDAV